MVGSCLKVQQNIIRNHFIDFFCWLSLVISQVSGLSNLWFLALQAVKGRLPLVNSSQAGLVISSLLHQFLCSLYKSTSCQQDKLQVEYFVWVSVVIAPLKVLSSYRRQQVQAPYLPVLGILAKVPIAKQKPSIAPGFYFDPEMPHSLSLLSHYSLPLYSSPDPSFPSPQALSPLMKCILFLLSRDIHASFPQLFLLFNLSVSVDCSMILLYFIADIHLKLNTQPICLTGSGLPHSE